MFLGNTQLKELLVELNFNLHKFDNVKDIIEDLKRRGPNSGYLSFTDLDNQQVCIKLSEDTFIYSQQTAFTYDWNEDNDRDVEFGPFLFKSSIMSLTLSNLCKLKLSSTRSSFSCVVPKNIFIPC